MSATLTWHKTGSTAKTGTTNSALITDMQSAIDSVAGDANFKWQTASSSTVGPLYLVLKPKSGAAGRILFVIWASAPAGNNAAILQAAPTTNTLYCAYFPNGNVDAPSNLTAASGTILGDDTGAVKVACGQSVATIYAASFQPWWFDSEEGGLFIFNNPAATATYVVGAGNLVVSASDTAYACTFSLGTNSLHNFVTSDPIPWAALSTTINAGSTANPCVRTNYGVTDDLFFMSFRPMNWLSNAAAGADDPLQDASVTKAWFVPMQLASRRKGIGFALKFRQLAWGPPSASAFQTYSTTGPVVAAIQICSVTAGGTQGFPYATNFKI